LNIILHCTTSNLWQTAIEKGEYTCESIEKEGFIHCCTQSQLDGVMDRYYPNTSDLIILEIDANRVQAEIKHEFSKSVGEKFAHIYGTLNVDAVVQIKKI
jgi:uncharacterized protein (DUF952 family)